MMKVLQALFLLEVLSQYPLFEDKECMLKPKFKANYAWLALKRINIFISLTNKNPLE